jgi:hypothetical protein
MRLVVLIPRQPEPPHNKRVAGLPDELVGIRIDLSVCRYQMTTCRYSEVGGSA